MNKMSDMRNRYLDYCKKLKFDEKPDYDFLRNLFIKNAELLKITPEYKWS